MQINDQVAGEAREKLADRIEIAVFAKRLQGEDSIALTISFSQWKEVIAALRAQPERGAEEMRERAAAVAHDEAAWMPYWEGQSIRFCIAAAIRALPVHPDKDEGGGR